MPRCRFALARVPMRARVRLPVLVRLLVLVLALLLAPRLAGAQLHWDAAAHAGAMKRLLAERPPGGDDAGFGPALLATAHVALIPLVRVGAYGSLDMSPLPVPAATRTLWGGGLRGKLMSPWPRGDVRAWLHLGFGYTATYAPSYSLRIAVPTGIGSQSRPADATVSGAGGGFFEIPVGLGVSYKLYDHWSLVGEVGARVGLAHKGSAYEDPGPTLSVPGQSDNNLLPSGRDRFAASLTVGIQLELR